MSCTRTSADASTGGSCNVHSVLDPPVHATQSRAMSDVSKLIDFTPRRLHAQTTSRSHALSLRPLTHSHTRDSARRLPDHLGGWERRRIGWRSWWGRVLCVRAFVRGREDVHGRLCVRACLCVVRACLCVRACLYSYTIVCCVLTRMRETSMYWHQTFDINTK